ncbi:MAG: aldo/keto reductase [Kiritimatiellia bacterium]|jgi:diketogulonate reductase-like aldo/keto reductase
MKQINNSSFTLANGVAIPAIGFGTWQIKDGPEATQAVADALRVGYRHIDTAAIYGNEASVGAAFRESGLPRDEVFITSKLWNSAKTFDQAMQGFDESMERLGLDVLDLYLLHWPAVAKNDPDWARSNRERWRALERLYKDGRIRAIGVSNFLPHHLQPLLDDADVAPMVDQLEIHPGYAQEEAVAFCKAHDILPQAWSPLACGKALDIPEVKAIAIRLRRTPAQVCMRWCFQNGVLPITKTTRVERMLENADIFNFTLTPNDLNAIASLPRCGACLDPDERNF